MRTELPEHSALLKPPAMSQADGSSNTSYTAKAALLLVCLAVDLGINSTIDDNDAADGSRLPIALSVCVTDVCAWACAPERAVLVFVATCY